MAAAKMAAKISRSVNTSCVRGVGRTIQVNELYSNLTEQGKVSDNCLRPILPCVIVSCMQFLGHASICDDNAIHFIKPKQRA